MLGVDAHRGGDALGQVVAPSYGRSAPTLNIWPWAAGRERGLGDDRRDVADVAERARLRPSPKIVIGSPRRIWFMKMPTTLR